jgi:hypothetical protein
MVNIYKYWDQVDTLGDIDTYVEFHDNGQWNCEPVKLDADVFYLIGYTTEHESIFSQYLPEAYTKEDINTELNRVFSTHNRKDIVVVYINSEDPKLGRAIQMLVNRLHLEGYEQVYLNYIVREPWFYETVEAL